MKSFPSPNDAEVYQAGGKFVLIYSPQISMKCINPPLVGIAHPNRPKVDNKSMCTPPVGLSADSGAGTINSDVTTICVRQNVGAFDGSQESKVE